MGVGWSGGQASELGPGPVLEHARPEPPNPGSSKSLLLPALCHSHLVVFHPKAGNEVSQGLKPHS